MPTRLPRRSAHLAGRIAALGLLGAAIASAHEGGDDALPGLPGWQVGAAVAVARPQADARWPTASLPGVLGTGSAPRDQRGGLRLEHGVLELAARFSGRYGARLAAGWHDRESAHTEAAVLQGGFAWGDDDVEWRLGRDTVRLGAVIDDAGHFDRFATVPLAKRAVLDGPWIDDGVTLAWKPAQADGVRALEVGLWRGRAFPGNGSGPAVPALHLHTGWSHLDAHLALARLQPRGRGAAAQSLGATGHVHGSLDCSASLQQRVCFDGKVEVLAGSLQWTTGRGDWTVAVAGLSRRERGALYSAEGDAAARLRVAGVWADIAWQPAARWTWAARLERLAPRNHLQGVGTASLSDDAGLSGAVVLQRATAAALWQPLDGVTLAVEAGRERGAGTPMSQVTLRAIWRLARGLGATW